VAVDHGLGLASVPGVRLCEVVEDGDELDVVARRGRRDLCEVGERRDISELVEAEKQRCGETPAVEVGLLVGVVDEFAEQREEDWT